MKKKLSLLFAVAIMLLGGQGASAAKTYYSLGGESQNGWSWGFKATPANSGTVAYALSAQWAGISLMGGYEQIDAATYPNYKITFAETAPEGMQINYAIDGADRYPGSIGGKTEVSGKMSGTSVTKFNIQATQADAGTVVLKDVVFYGDDEAAGIHPTYVAPDWGGSCATANLSFTGRYGIAYAVGAEGTSDKIVTVMATAPIPEGVQVYYKAGDEEHWMPLSGKTEVSFNVVGEIYCIGVQCALEGVSEENPVVVEGVTFYTEDIPSEDPLAESKAALSSAIAMAKTQNAVAKTEDSFAALQQAITDAEAALDASDATEESLAAAVSAINSAIEGLVLTEGYTNLTKDMFMTHVSQGGEGSATGCAYDLNKKTGMPYGDGNVGWLNYADLSKYNKLVVAMAEGAPRFCMNRTADGAQDNGNSETSQFIDISGTSWGAQAYLSKEGDNVYVVNLTQLVADKGIAYLHSIKGLGGAQVTVTGMYLYKDADPLAAYKEVLEAAIAKGKAVNAFGKTEDSFGTLAGAISDGESALAAAESQDALESAAAAITSAITGLQLAAGFSTLTNGMFQVWDGDGIDAQPTSATPGFEQHVGSAVGQGTTVWGNGSVDYLQYGDVSDYAKLYLVGTPNATFRVLLNRKESNSGPLLEFTVVTDENGVGEVDLQNGVDKDGKKIADDGFAHVNAIKTPYNGQTVVITDILLEASTTVPVTITNAGYATFCSKKAVALETAMKAYAVEYAGTSALLIPVEGSVEANTPVILKAEEGDYDLNIVESGAAPEKNDLLVSDGNVVGDGKVYVLANGTKGVGFYKLAEGVKIPAGKAYLEVNANGREFIGFGDATAIKNIETVKADGAIYNLAGQQVKSAQKGVFIVNGKKAVVK